MPKKSPNVLWICTDQQRYDTIGALGYDYIHTPNLDSLVAEGVGFNKAFCQSPICTPSRSSFLTGMYPSSIGACVNGNDYWAGQAPLISKIFAEHGYTCGLVGKLHLSCAYKRVEQRTDDGYSYYVWSHGPQNRWGDGNAYTAWLRKQGVDPDLPEYPVEYHHTTWCTQKAIEFIKGEHESPFFLSVNYYDPHHPFDPPKEYAKRYDPNLVPYPLFKESDLVEQEKLKEVDFQTEARNPDSFDIQKKKAAYFAMIELIDTGVGRLIDALIETNQKDDTIILFMSDHGEMLGDHGLLLKGCRFYEGLVRVPLLFSFPRKIKDLHKSDALVELVDIAPTLIELCDLPIPSHMQGKSFVPVLRGISSTHKNAVRSEYYAALHTKLAPSSALIAKTNRKNSYGTMLRTERYKLVVYHGVKRGELYDLQEDPNEFTNMWDDTSCDALKLALMKESFDALAYCVYLGPEQVGLY